MVHGRVLLTRATSLAVSLPSTLLVCALLLVASGAAGGDAPPLHSPARNAEERAVALGRKGDWAGCVRELDAALAGAPDWADAHYLRGAAYVELARVDVSREALADTAGKHDYRRGAELLAKATADFRAYLTLSPEAPDRAAIEQAIGAYRARQAEAQAAEAAAHAREREAARKVFERHEDEAGAKHDAQRAQRADRRAAAFVFGGIGLAAIGGAVGLEFASRSAFNAIRAGSVDSYRLGQPLRTGNAMHAGAIVLGAAGLGADVAAAIVLIANRDPGPYARRSYGVWVGPGQVGLRGSF